MSIERFAEWYPRYRQFISETIYRELYNFLASPQSIWAMARVSEAEKPALSAIVKDLEGEFQERFDFDNPTNRRMIGSMIKEILHDFGFRRKGQRLVSNSKYFSSASYYQLEAEKAINTVTGMFQILNVDLPQSALNNEFNLIEDKINEQAVTQIKKPLKNSEKCIDEYGKIKKLLRELGEVVEDDDVDEQVMQESLMKLISIGQATLTSLSTLLNTIDNKTNSDSLIPAQQKRLTMISLTEELKKTGIIEVRKGELNQVLDEILLKLKSNEDIRVLKTDVGYKVILNKSNHKGSYEC